MFGHKAVTVKQVYKERKATAPDSPRRAFIRRIMSGRAWRSIAALFLCLCMVAPALAGVLVPFTSNAAGGSTNSGPTGGVTREADPSTMDTYIDMLDLLKDTRYAGRLWTDKSVFAYGQETEQTVVTGGGNSSASAKFAQLVSGSDGDLVREFREDKLTLTKALDGVEEDGASAVSLNSDFLEVFSALGSSISINEYPTSPIDLVIIIDMSASMAQDTRYGIDENGGQYQTHNAAKDDSGQPWPTDKDSQDPGKITGVPMKERIANSRIQKTLDAVNDTIDKLMAQNPENRVAVVGYGAGAAVLMPLAHYKRGYDLNGKGEIEGSDEEDYPYLSVGGMETLCHPGDLQPMVVNGVVEWGWFNNRDACYTVEVHAQTNKLDKAFGDLYSPVVDDSFHSYDLTVSNNVKNDAVRAFPGVKKQTSASLTLSAVLRQAQNKIGEYKIGIGASSSNNDVGHLAETMEHAKAGQLQADKYIGYFTNTQGGIYLGLSQLADKDVATTFEARSAQNNSEMTSVPRIPAAIVMTDGGANIAFNKMDHWNSADPNDDMNKYGGWDSSRDDFTSDNHNNGDDDEDKSHRLPGTGREWYEVYLPGIDGVDENAITTLFNKGMESGTLSAQPRWNYAGIFYSNDKDVTGTSGTILQVLMTAAYMKTAVDKHYEAGWNEKKIPEDKRLELQTYTVSVDSMHLPQWGKMRLYPTMNPAKYSLEQEGWWNDEAIFGKSNVVLFTYKDDNGSKINMTLGDVYQDMKTSWGNWKTWKEPDKLPDASIGYPYPTLRVNLARLEETGYTDDKFGVTITNQDIVDNIVYNDAFYDVESGQLGDIFNLIYSRIVTPIFTPVEGQNDLGVQDAVTFMDPIGKYMEVKGVTKLLLFGELYSIRRTAVYSYEFNEAYLAKHPEAGNGKADGGSTAKFLPSGWYKGDDGADAIYGGVGETPNASGSGGSENGDKYTDADAAWSDGWVYRLGADLASEFVPSLTDVKNDENGENAAVAKMRHTEYTFYRVASKDTDDGSGEIDPDKWHRNPAYGEEPDNVDEEVLASERGAYRMNDLRIWVEDTGDYGDSDIDEGGLKTDISYDEALWINVPMYMLPLRTVTVTEQYDENGESTWGYTSNMTPPAENGQGGETSASSVSAYKASFPLRIFYEVGVEESLLTADHHINTAAVSAEYVKNNKAVTDVAKEARGVGEGDLEFFSNWYNPENRYNEYITSTSEYSYGDPAATFAPSGDNRYYIFQKPLPLYRAAYTYDPEGGEGSSGGMWTRVDGKQAGSEAGGSAPGATGSGIGTFGALNGASGTSGGLNQIAQSASGTNLANFGGKVIAEDLELTGSGYGGSGTDGSITEGDLNDSDKAEEVSGAIESELYKLNSPTGGGSSSSPNAGDVVLLNLDRLKDVTKGDTDPFPSTNYYFVPIDYFELTPNVPGGAGSGGADSGIHFDGSATEVKYCVARLGSEFGSAYQSSGISNGDMLCWYDKSGNTRTQFDYFSYTDTGDKTRGMPTWEKLTLTDGTAQSGTSSADKAAKSTSKTATKSGSISGTKSTSSSAAKTGSKSGTKAGSKSDAQSISKSATKAGIRAAGVTGEAGQDYTSLSDYLRRYCGIEDTEELNRQVAYWTKKQEELAEVLKAAHFDPEGNQGGQLTRDEFDKYFDFTLSAKPGGLRVGDLAQAIGPKLKGYIQFADSASQEGDKKGYFGPIPSDSSDLADKYTQLFSYIDSDSEHSNAYKNERFPDKANDDSFTILYYMGNITRTANNYYLPSIHINVVDVTAEGTDGAADGAESGKREDIVVNTYLGNNGRLLVSDTSLLMTKIVEPPLDGYPIDPAKNFNFQVFIDGRSGDYDAIVVKSEDGGKTWQRQLHYIDLKLGPKLFLLNTDGTKVMVDKDGNRVVQTGTNPDGTPKYVYADKTDEGGSQLPFPGTGGDGPGADPQLYYVFIGTNTGEENTGGSENVMRVYHNMEVHESDKPGDSGSGDQSDSFGEVSTDDITVEEEKDGGGNKTGKVTYKATKVWLLPTSEYDEFALNPYTQSYENDKGEPWDIESTDESGQPKYIVLGDGKFKLLTVGPSTDASRTSTADIAIDTPYSTQSAYWTKTVHFGLSGQTATTTSDNGSAAAGGINADGSSNKSGGTSGKSSKAAAISEGSVTDLYDPTEPHTSGDRTSFGKADQNSSDASGYNSYTMKNLLDNTANVTLRHGYGLLFTGIQMGTNYRFTEQLTDADIKEGYAFKNVKHSQQYGSWNTYTEGENKFTDLGTSYNGQSYQVKEGGEGFYHSNARIVESYATFEDGQTGNHHQTEDTAVGSSSGTQTTISKNPACHLPTTNAGAGTVADTGDSSGQTPGVDYTNENDPEITKGTVRHYFVKDGELVDKHYAGEQEAFDNNRYVVGCTAHFLVADEANATGSSIDTQTGLPNKVLYDSVSKRTDYTGVYSVYGDTGVYEEAAHFTNTYVKPSIVVEKQVMGDHPDTKKEFTFTIKLFVPDDKTVEDWFVIPQIFAKHIYDDNGERKMDDFDPSLTWYKADGTEFSESSSSPSDPEPASTARSKSDNSSAKGVASDTAKSDVQAEAAPEEENTNYIYTEFTLKHGEMALFYGSGLPTGTRYEVSEQKDSKYLLQHVEDGNVQDDGQKIIGADSYSDPDFTDGDDRPGDPRKKYTFDDETDVGTVTGVIHDTDFPADVYLIFYNSLKVPLPSTGGLGVWGVILLGLILLLIAGAVFAVSRRKRKTVETAADENITVGETDDGGTFTT